MIDESSQQCGRLRRVLAAMLKLIESNAGDTLDITRILLQPAKKRRKTKLRVKLGAIDRTTFEDVGLVFDPGGRGEQDRIGRQMDDSIFMSHLGEELGRQV